MPSPACAARPGSRACACTTSANYVATRLLSEGVDVRTVAGRLGHRNASTTLNVYSHFLPEADREAADLLGRIFDDALLEVTELPPAEEEETG